MRKLNILKALINYFFAFTALATFASLILVPIVLFSSEETLNFKVNGTLVELSSLFGKIILALSTIGALIFLYSIYLLRKIINLFVKRDLFNIQISKSFSSIGKCIIFSSLLINVPIFFYNSRESFAIEFGNGGNYSLLYLISLGLFFMVLSEVFVKAKNIKDENELTI